jgi:hypothetical protein
VKYYRDLDAAKEALNVALFRITNNRVLSFIFIVLALVLGTWAVLEFWDVVASTILRNVSD